MPELIVENLTKEFPTRGDPLVVLRDVSLALGQGQNVAVVGPSGSGKSTLLNIIGTLQAPTSGRVVLDGLDPATLDEPALAAFRSRSIGFVFLLPLTIRIEVHFPPCQLCRPQENVSRAPAEAYDFPLVIGGVTGRSRLTTLSIGLLSRALPACAGGGQQVGMDRGIARHLA